MNQQPKLEEINNDTPTWLNDIPPENMLWGIGMGNLSSVSTSCELAKFNAQTSICRQISYYVKHVENPLNEFLQRDLIDQLNIYQNQFYMFLADYATDQISFELSKLVKIEKRTKTSDGTIWYLISLKKDEAEKIGIYINEYIKNYCEEYIIDIEEILLNKRTERIEEAIRILDLSPEKG
jgi:hypothetical protein